MRIHSLLIAVISLVVFVSLANNTLAQDTKQTTVQRILRLVKAKKVDEAAKALEAAITSEQDSDEEKLPLLRTAIASGYAKSRKYGKAFEQYDKLMQFKLGHDVALIDREGNVQMVKVGAGGDTAKEIHAKLSELILQ